MKVGIVGSGQVGRALGTGFATLGHDVKIGTREPGNDKLAEWVMTSGGRASVGTVAEAAAFGDIGVIATAWAGTENALRLAGPQNLAGKVVIDVTNPLAFEPSAPPRLTVGFTDSAGEAVQRWLPGARVVKAFNIITNSQMFRPTFKDGPATMFICGDDDAAKQTVLGICHDFGWQSTIDVGGLEAARLLEPLAVLWCVYGVRSGTWDHAFRLIRG
jgi:8-hydroxy-5-deazaflavin:NADPH oxidoreductase